MYVVFSLIYITERCGLSCLLGLEACVTFMTYLFKVLGQRVISLSLGFLELGSLPGRAGVEDGRKTGKESRGWGGWAGPV